MHWKNMILKTYKSLNSFKEYFCSLKPIIEYYSSTFQYKREHIKRLNGQILYLREEWELKRLNPCTNLILLHQNSAL